MVSSLYFHDGTLKQNLTDDELRSAVRSGAGLLWVNFHKPVADEIFKLDDVFGFHPLAIEDCQHTSQYPKLDDFGTYLFIVFLAPNPEFKAGAESTNERAIDPVQEIDLFLGPNYVVTYHVAPLPFMQGLVDRVKRDPKRVLGRGASFLVHDILDVAVDQFFTVVEKFQDESEEAELQLHKTGNLELLTGILELKRRVLSLRRQMNDHREMIQRLLRENHPAVAAKSHLYFRNILDHLNQIEDDLDVCRDTIDHAREVFLAYLDARANQIMKVLTVLFTLSLPFTVLTSWYGMNFKVLPFMDEPWGVYALSALMFGISGGIILWMRKNKWF